MTWHPILVGVDGSAESAHAAKLGYHIAQRAGVSCRLVSAVPDYGPTFSVPESGISIENLNEAALVSSRRLVEHSLEGVLSAEQLQAIDVRLGRAPSLLAEEARRSGAEVVVLGGKHRRAIARIAGSTITHVVRMGTVPVLATSENVSTIRRVLVAVDLSEAAKPTIDAAERWATLFGAELRVMHSTEPLPVVPGFSIPLEDDDFYRRTSAKVESAIAPLVAYPGAELVVRRGRPAATISAEAQRWRADLVVLGSHGKGWVDRLLIGSTSERLLHVLPVATLVVPVMHAGPHHAWVGTEASAEARLAY